MHRVDAVGNSPGVHQELAEGIGNSPGWRTGVCQKKTETRQRIVGGSRKACRERFAEGIGKFAGNMKGDHQEKTRRRAARMPDYAGWLMTGKLPRSAGELPVPGFFGYRFGLHPKKIGSGYRCALRRTREWT
ncbi:hypothetical protein B296_00011682 [Ensete ventricosum]|uniref:Uncharacterized protein n=1 Tax=Ensete ventricosum TaxID=4639 RepID=A0A426XZ60_ENSVE|nr:hypothetical protein B296_00011682 [Ensete ventricosum]